MCLIEGRGGHPNTHECGWETARTGDPHPRPVRPRATPAKSVWVSGTPAGPLIDGRRLRRGMGGRRETRAGAGRSPECLHPFSPRKWSRIRSGHSRRVPVVRGVFLSQRAGCPHPFPPEKWTRLRSDHIGLNNRGARAAKKCSHLASLPPCVMLHKATLLSPSPALASAEISHGPIF